MKLNEKGEPAEIQRQDVKLTHVPWKRFHWEPAKSWEHVDWVAFDEYLTKEEIAKAYDGKAPSQEGKSASDGRTESDKYQQTYRVTEIWYKPTRTVYVLGWEFDELLEVRKDALNLQDFYPCPRPMFANVRSNELTPTPDHRFNRKAYEYVNRLVQRIHSITKEIKAAGFYDAQLTELSQLAAVDDGTYLPISNLAERLAATGITDFNKVMATLPMTEKVTVVRELQTLLDAEKYRLDEANGISDIVRGTTDPNETATAQTIKGNWASLRCRRNRARSPDASVTCSASWRRSWRSITRRNRGFWRRGCRPPRKSCKCSSPTWAGRSQSTWRPILRLQWRTKPRRLSVLSS